MKCRPYETTEAFLASAADFFTGREAENTILLGALRHMAEAPLETDLRLAVEEAGKILLTAAYRRPHGFIVSHGDPEAVPCLLGGVERAGRHLRGVVGPDATAKAVAASIERSGGVIRPKMTIALYRLTELTPPGVTAGRLCRARECDLPWLVEWAADFLPAVGFGPADPTVVEEQTADRIGRKELYYWRVAGEPVSLAGCQTTAPAGDGGRINLVYTPPGVRGRGYATACVGALTKRLLTSGWDYSVIMADRANPVSNSIYRRLGYREIETLRIISFADPE